MIYVFLWFFTTYFNGISILRSCELCSDWGGRHQILDHTKYTFSKAMLTFVVNNLWFLWGSKLFCYFWGVRESRLLVSQIVKDVFLKYCRMYFSEYKTQQSKLDNDPVLVLVRATEDDQQACGSLMSSLLKLSSILIVVIIHNLFPNFVLTWHGQPKVRTKFGNIWHFSPKLLGHTVPPPALQHQLKSYEGKTWFSK